MGNEWWEGCVMISGMGGSGLDLYGFMEGGRGGFVCVSEFHYYQTFDGRNSYCINQLLAREEYFLHIVSMEEI